MRTTNEVMESARLGDSCTEEELRLCITSMRATMLIMHMTLTEWACDENLPFRVRIRAKGWWESVNTGWNIPLDKRVEPHNRPGNPELLERKAFAERVYTAAGKRSTIR